MSDTCGILYLVVEFFANLTPLTNEYATYEILKEYLCIIWINTIKKKKKQQNFIYHSQTINNTHNMQVTLAWTLYYDYIPLHYRFSYFKVLILLKLDFKNSTAHFLNLSWSFLG